MTKVIFDGETGEIIHAKVPKAGVWVAVWSGGDEAQDTAVFVGRSEVEANAKLYAEIRRVLNYEASRWADERLTPPVDTDPWTHFYDLVNGDEGYEWLIFDYGAPYRAEFHSFDEEG